MIVNYFKKFVLTIMVIGSAMLTGCATIITGDSEDISIDTTPVSGADCQVSNSRGNWKVQESPNTVTVKRSMSSLNIDCKTKDGYSGHRSVSSSVKSTAAGNIILGGVIGAGVDAASGAAFDYPDSITVPMKKTKQAKKA